MFLHAFFFKVGHLASQAGKRQTRIMRVPEMMCPKKGTNIIGFLPESEENSYKDNPIPSCSIFTDSDLPERGPR